MTASEFDIVVFHGNCYDGHTSAWVAHKHSPNAVFVPAQYKDAPPDVAGKRVLICDFSYPRAALIEMHTLASHLVVLDHHKTAQADLEGLDFCVFDMDRSGAGITWDYLFSTDPRPQLVDMVQDRDLWRFEISGSKAYHAALTAVAMTFENWDAIAAIPVEQVVRNGEAILAFTQLIAEKFAARARLVLLGDVEVWAVNCPVEFVSETAEVLKNREPHRPILGWSWDGSRGNFYCSLRSRDDGPDVSAIAKLWGGGGHEHAAGFQTDHCPVAWVQLDFDDRDFDDDEFDRYDSDSDYYTRFDPPEEPPAPTTKPSPEAVEAVRGFSRGLEAKSKQNSERVAGQPRRSRP